MKQLLIATLTLLLYSEGMYAQKLPNIILQGRVLSDSKTAKHLYYKQSWDHFYGNNKIELKPGGKYRLDVSKTGLKINSLSEIQFTLDTLVAPKDEACIYTVKAGSILEYAYNRKMEAIEVTSDIPLECSNDGRQFARDYLSPFQEAFAGTYGRFDSSRYSTLQVNAKDMTFTVMLPDNSVTEGFSQIIGKWNVVREANSDTQYKVILTSEYRFNPKFNTRVSYPKTEAFQALYYPGNSDASHPMGMMMIQPKGSARFETY